MKSRLVHHLLAALLGVAVTTELTAQTTAFTYQGRLSDNGQPANGLYDLRFELWHLKGSVGVITNAATPVSQGSFTVMLDFGGDVFTGDTLWLEIGVATNGEGGFVTLSPRQLITSTPYAIHAATASNAELVSGDISANQLTSGTVPSDRLSGTYGSPLTLSNAFNTFKGTYSGDGSGLSRISSLDAADGSPAEAVFVDDNGNVGVGTNNPATALHVVGTVTAEGFDGPVAASQLTGTIAPATIAPGTITGTKLANGTVGSVQIEDGSIGEAELTPVLANETFWRLGGNAATTVGTDFIGTTDDRPLELRANGKATLRLQPTFYGPSIVGGYEGNEVAAGVAGAVIAGGGQANDNAGTNRVTASLGTISGGKGNTVEAPAASIGGGVLNQVQIDAFSATISGGRLHLVESNATDATIGGGQGNRVGTNAAGSTIAGGLANQIGSEARWATLGGGYLTSIGSGADGAVVAGGVENASQGKYAVVGGGWQNFAGGEAATVAGGTHNHASGSAATIPGGTNNWASGDFSFAAGHGARSSHRGSFVWADSTESGAFSTAPDQFLVYAEGGVGIGTNNPRSALHVAGKVTADAYDGPIAASQITGTIAPANIAPGAISQLGTPDGSNPSAVQVTDSGNVGVGTVTPTEKLEVDGGNIRIRGVGGYDEPGESAYLYLGSSTRTYVKSTRNFGMNLGTVGAEDAITIRSQSGNVGIGTTNPATALDVAGAVTADGFNGPIDASQLTGSISSSQLAPGAAAENLAASGQSGVPSGGMILSASPNDSNLANAGYVKLGKVDLGDVWEQRADTGAPSARANHTVVWTGSEMIVWGGFSYDGAAHRWGDGGRYDPAANTWTAVSLTGAPSARSHHAAVWTGSEMIVWGGSGQSYLNDGGGYNPATDSWTAMGTTTAPTGRYGHTAVWTGTEMIVWGGFNTDSSPPYLDDGGRYNPATDTWIAVNTIGAPAGRDYHTAVWSGSEMIVWGGANGGSYLNDGGRYDPGSDSWVAVNAFGAPAGREYHTAVWTGSEMIVWGGANGGSYLNDGGRFDPVSNSWRVVPANSALNGRINHTAVWTGSEMIIWGGGFSDGSWHSLGDGGRFSPVSGGWSAVTTTSAPAGRRGHTSVWTGSEMIVWGGYSEDYLNDTFSYMPSRALYLYREP